MKIKIVDIPPEGRELEFNLDNHGLSERAQAVRASAEPDTILPPEYNFLPAPTARLQLRLEGSTVVISGETSAGFVTTCARCAEETENHLLLPIQMVLKPRSVRKSDEEEDMNFGYYDGREIDCSSVVEEFLILALPFRALCSPDCKGLCPCCGANLNQAACDCFVRSKEENRFALLNGLRNVTEKR